MIVWAQSLPSWENTTGLSAAGFRWPADFALARYPARWSVIAYDNQARSFLQTDQAWPSVTSKDKEFHANDDGSVDVYFAPERPKNAKSFVQTIPNKGWNAIFRLYGPLEPWFDKSWRLGEIELVE